MADEKRPPPPCSHPKCSACAAARIFTEDGIESREEMMVTIALALCSGIGEAIVSLIKQEALILCHEHAHDVAEITRRLGLPQSEIHVVRVPDGPPS